MARRYELYSSSTDDEVIGCVRNITEVAQDIITGQGGSGTEVLTALQTTPVDDDASDETVTVSETAALWAAAVTEATVDEVFAKRRSENRFSRTDVNDTEALRTPSVLYVLWHEIAANRAFGTVTEDVVAYRAGFKAAIFEVASRLAWELNDDGGEERLSELTLSVDILNARHHAEGWGYIAQAVEQAVAEVRAG